jgi:hypothetical protein
MADLGATWDRRLQRIKEIAEAIGEKACDQGKLRRRRRC